MFRRPTPLTICSPPHLLQHEQQRARVLPAEAAAHVAEADKSESHGSGPVLTEKVNITLYAGNRVRRFGRDVK